ncbi:MAG: hypothetical protein GXP57_05280 [Deltaproteobacteria bacterium]|nr:hypothetical protein [Deltaproteobacteria bacterium]
MMTTTKPQPVQLIPMEAITGWEEFLRDGEAYLKTAVAAHQKRQDVFTPEILYNIIAMAIEKFVMAALMRHGTLPYNHTMTDLVESMEETFPGDISAGLIKMDKYQDICALDNYHISPPAMEEIPGMLELGQKLRSLVVNKLLATGRSMQ